MIDESTTKFGTTGKSDINRASEEALGTIQATIEKPTSKQTSIEILSTKATVLEDQIMKDGIHDSLDTNKGTTEILGTKATALEDPTMKDSTSDSPATKMTVPELSSKKATSTEISGSNLTVIEDPAIEILFKFEEDLVEDGKAKMTIVSEMDRGTGTLSIIFLV